MLPLIWAFINVGAFLFFFIIASRAIKLVAEKYGIVASIILVIGLLGLIVNSSANSTNKRMSSRTKSLFVDHNSIGDSYLSNIRIKDNLISHIDLSAAIGKYKNNDSLVVTDAGAYSYGFSAGYKWETNHVMITPIGGTGKFRYAINATETWALLGVPLYTTSGEFEGEFLPVKSE